MKRKVERTHRNVCAVLPKLVSEKLLHGSLIQEVIFTRISASFLYEKVQQAVSSAGTKMFLEGCNQTTASFLDFSSPVRLLIFSSIITSYEQRCDMMNFS